MLPPQDWLITDTHFNHAKIIELCSRPQNSQQLIIENWQRLVRPEDTVFHLGDVIFSRASELKPILDSLPGKKILVRGNHDMNKSQWYVDRGFTFVCYGLEHQHAYMTHKPSKHLPEGCTVNIHGHLHNTPHRDAEYEPRPYHRLLSIELENYTPILLSDFLKRG